MECAQHDIVCWQNGNLLESFSLGECVDWDLSTGVSDIQIQVVPAPGKAPIVTFKLGSNVAIRDAKARIITVTCDYSVMLTLPPGEWFYDVLVNSGGSVAKRAEGRFKIMAKRTLLS